MPLHRFNTKTTSPNPYFNFITALPPHINAPNLPSQDDAKALLQALAAQVRPLCKKHGFNVNSFEEVCHNLKASGRIFRCVKISPKEIVLRRSDGSFHNIQHLIQVVCHELAHIKFPGMYSSGNRLSDSTEVAGRGLRVTDFDLPEYMCGGAQDRRRASTLRRAPRGNGGPKPKRRKAGTRVRSKYAFVGQGNALNEHATGEQEKKRGTGFKKRAQSAKERQARLEAIEQRLKSLESMAMMRFHSANIADVLYIENSNGKPDPQSGLEPAVEAGSDSESGSESFKETDDMRRKLLADSGAGWKFSTIPDAGPTGSFDDDIINLLSDDEDQDTNQARAPPKSTPSKKLELQKQGPSNPLTNMVHNEVEHRKQEQLGLVGSHKLGGGGRGAHQSRLLDTPKVPQPSKSLDVCFKGGQVSDKVDEWACLVCTCLNHEDYGVCQACSTRRGCHNFTSEL
ncbi:WLM domain-containing protein [Rhizoctonia solani AG-1 IA]|uniref:WLM domain-containing protein n=1 Tax=Thanatephorus cucumeris (strain AG1-IA) TaxID=983506 RepID=L8WVE9_THACA|nr:WLM domain-containing protein [Rhizoctonia solani AG-1 IA]